MCSVLSWIKTVLLLPERCIRTHAQKQRKLSLYIPSNVYKEGGLASQFLYVDLCLWILPMHHWGMQGSVNVCRLPFFLNNPFGTSRHVQLKSKWAVCDPHFV